MKIGNKLSSELLKKKFGYEKTFLPYQDFLSCEFVKDKKIYDEELFEFIVKTSNLHTPVEDFAFKRHKDFALETLGSNPVALRFLKTIVQLKQPKRVLEIGTFLGISSLYMAESMPLNSSVVTIEKFTEFAEIAKENFKNNNMEQKIKLLIGDALEVIPSLDKEEYFDLIFLDGDKGMYDEYFKLLDPLLNRNGVLIVDDVFFHGDLLNDIQVTEKGKGIKRFLEDIEKKENYSRMILPITNGMLVMIKE